MLEYYQHASAGMQARPYAASRETARYVDVAEDREAPVYRLALGREFSRPVTRPIHDDVVDIASVNRQPPHLPHHLDTK
jgi:hypothetical protein